MMGFDIVCHQKIGKDKHRLLITNLESNEKLWKKVIFHE